MEDCLFCKIAAGEIPSNKLFEDDKLLAFYDIDPQAPVHFLVIPKQHVASAAALTEDDAALLGHIYAVIAQLCKKLGRLLLRNVLRLLSVPAASFQELCVLVQQLFFFFSLEDTSLCSS